MNGRTIVTIVIGILIAIVLVGAGVGIYNAGISQGIVEAGRVPVGQPVAGGYGYGYGWHPGFFGFGFFGILFPILFILLLVGLARAAFGAGRRGGPGWGWGPDGPGRYGPNGWQEDRERRMAELHRRLHDEEAGHAGTSGGTGTA